MSSNHRESDRRRVLVVRWGELRIHDINFAYVLAKNYDVEFALFSPHYAYRSAAGTRLLDEARDNFRVFEWRVGPFTRQLGRLHSAAERMFKLSSPWVMVGARFPMQLRALVKANRYWAVVPIEQYSLYSAWHGAAGLAKIFYYSLEVQTSDDDDVSFGLKRMLLEERAILPRVDGVIIQDACRLAVLYKNRGAATPKIHFIPLFSRRPLHGRRSDYLRNNLEIARSRRIVLYYGAFYAERFIDALANEFKIARRDDLTLVLHNPQMDERDAGRFRIMGQNVRPSQAYLEVDELDDMVASADIGIALYDNNKLNTRFTAYSSEKIVTYLRCGIPFIAFNNESYQDLKKRYDCCALIDSVDQVVDAAATLIQNYEHHSRNARCAYQDVFYRTEFDFGVDAPISTAQGGENG